MSDSDHSEHATPPPEHHQHLSLEERHEELNTLFGFRPWKAHVRRRSLSERSEVVRTLYEDHPPPSKDLGEDLRHLYNLRNPWNASWVIFLGLMFFTFYAFAALLLTIFAVSRPQARLAWRLARYWLFPFGKFIGHVPGMHDEVPIVPPHEETPLQVPSRRFRAPRGADDAISVGDVLWWVVVAFPMSIVHAIVAFFAWELIVTIPIAKLNKEAIRVLWTPPRSLTVYESAGEIQGEIILASYEAVNVAYFKYSVFGTAVAFFNMLPLVLVSLFFGYVEPEGVSEVFVFVVSILAAIPLAYFIGAAVASISAQSSFAVGAVLNASFGSMVELILYVSAANKGLYEVIRAGVTGSLLGCLLLFPGLSMVFGGIKYTEQRFNAKATGVGSLLLIVAVLGAFTPTVFYNSYGQYALNCGTCDAVSAGGPLSCVDCHYVETANEMDHDALYLERTRPLMYTVAIMLPILYFVGLLFTLRTHSHIFEHMDDEESGDGHDAPEWSKMTCVVVLMSSVLAFALVSEKVVDTFTPFVQKMGVSELFAGMTVIALVPSSAEMINAVLFALQNNMALSIETGSSAAVQIVMIQMPVLVLISYILDDGLGTAFTLVFSSTMFYSVFLGVLVFSFALADGRSNYFFGAALLVAYSIMLAQFWYVPS